MRNVVVAVVATMLLPCGSYGQKTAPAAQNCERLAQLELPGAKIGSAAAEMLRLQSSAPNRSSLQATQVAPTARSSAPPAPSFAHKSRRPATSQKPPQRLRSA